MSSDDIEITREDRYSTYAWYPVDVDGMRNFVDALYGVGAIGDEPVTYSEYHIKVKIASDDLMPKPAEGVVRMRHAEYMGMRRAIVALKVIVILLGFLVAVFLTLWVMTLVI